MPALPAAPGVVRLQLHHTFAGQNVYNILHVARNDLTDVDPIPLDEMNSIAFDTYSAWLDHVMPLLNPALVFRDVEATDLTSDTGLKTAFLQVNPGGRGGVALPASVAACVSWNAAVRYRGGHARTYLAGINQADTDDPRHFGGTWLGLATTAMNAFAVDPPTGYQYVLLRRVFGGVQRTPPLVYPLGSPSINSRIDSQRRRLGRV